IYRGTYALSQAATAAYESARKKLAAFIGAEADEIVFTKGTTSAINLAAFGYFRWQLGPGDEIALTAAEHHSNLIPWQQVAKATGAKLVFLPLDKKGAVDLAGAEKVLTSRVRLLALAQVDNVLGTEQPVKELAAMAKKQGALVLIDGAQAAGHLPVDVKELGSDFYAFSGHKMLAQTGIGVLYGRRELLEQTRPLEFGGEMIREVSLTDASFKPAPQKFEAGSQNVSGAISLGAAVDYLTGIGLEAIRDREASLGRQMAQGLEAAGATVYGYGGGIVAFNLPGIHPHDLATALDAQGIAIRAGQHCAQPLMDWLGVSAVARASAAFYNDESDVRALVQGVSAAKEFFNGTR
ncbi:cysteine desulfurase, partial [Lactobacillus nasalidis]